VIAFGLIYWKLDRGGPVARTQTPGKNCYSGRTDRPPRFSAQLAGYYLFMVETGQFFRPGELVPVSGIYRCGVDEHEDHRFESTDVRGHRFPPLPGGCRGGHWVLERATAHR